MNDTNKADVGEAKLPESIANEASKPTDEFTAVTVDDTKNEPVLAADAMVELGERPLKPVYLNDMAELQVRSGISSDQVEKKTREYSMMYGQAVKEALNGNNDTIDLSFLDTIEQNSKKSRHIREFLRQGVVQSVSVPKKSPEFINLLKSLRSASSVRQFVDFIANFSENAPEYEQVMIYFANAMSLLIYGQGNLQADYLSSFLNSAQLQDADGNIYPLSTDLKDLLGSEDRVFENQNSDPGQKISARITADVVMLSQGRQQVDLSRIFAKMKKKKPVLESADLPKQIVDALSNFEGFKTGLEAVRSDLVKARAKTSAIQNAEATNRETLVELRGVQELRRTSQDQKQELVRRINAPGISDGERETLREELRGVEAVIAQHDADINRLNARIKQIGNQDIEANEQENLAIANLKEFVAQFFAYVKKVSGKINIQIADFQFFERLRALISLDLNVDENRENLINFLTPENVLELEDDLLKFKEMVVETRPLTQEEYSLMLLTEFYLEVFPQYSKDTIHLMATSHYIRLKKENNLQEFKRKMLHERAEANFRGVEKRSSKDMVKLIARDRLTSLAVSSNNPTGVRKFDMTEVEAMEVIDEKMSLRDLREHVVSSGISMDSLNYLMYNLASFFVPRKLSDGSMATLKNSTEISKAEIIISNISKLLSEYAALKVMDEAKGHLLKGEQLSAVSLAKGLKVYNDSNEQNEQSILVASGHRAAHIMSKAALKNRRKEILRVAEEQDWTEARLDQELRSAGIAGFNKGATFSEFYARKLAHKTTNLLKSFGQAAKNGAKRTWRNKGEIAKWGTVPIWGAPWLAYKGAKATWNGTKFVGKKLAAVPGALLTGLSLGVAGAVAVAASPLAVVNAVGSGVTGAIEAGKTRAATQKAQIKTRINEIINPSNN